MLVYISGPITGTSDYLKRFAEAAGELAGAGYTVVNPAAVNDRLPYGVPYEMYMDTSIAMLKHCDAICMLRGWAASEGAHREYGYAKAHGMKFIDFDTLKVIEKE